ncbi:hypothetical protein GGX14DRAFT_564249 [Mycena pura]|uniref:Uncharacterized protein n=1 Tax=Mycena pura TaxID=153505 RepID=A0AAD6YEI1_9AGAR|nr:hypothetical protein GGX14DRAFT_564249 [Mycena pura]
MPAPSARPRRITLAPAARTRCSVSPAPFPLAARFPPFAAPTRYVPLLADCRSPFATRPFSLAPRCIRRFPPHVSRHSLPDGPRPARAARYTQSSPLATSSPRSPAVLRLLTVIGCPLTAVRCPLPEGTDPVNNN